MNAFKPQLIYVSAGFDAHRRDPLANLRLEAEDFAWATRHAMAAHPGGARAVPDDLPLPRDDEVARLRVPPHSIEAEQSVLGGLLLDNSAWDRAGDLLTDSATLGAYQDLTIRTGGTLQHGGGAQAVAGRDLALVAARLDQGDRPGAVSAAGAAAASPSGFTALAGSLDARVSGALAAQDGQWIAGRALSLAAQDISLSGARTQLAAGQAPGGEGGLSVLATAGLTASDALLAANGSLKLGGAHVALTGSQVTGQDVTLTAHGADDATSPAAHLDRSLVTARRDLTLEATTGSLVLSASQAQAGQAQAGHTLALTGSAAVVLDSGSAAVSQGDLRLGGARGVNAGTVQADGQLTLTTAALTNNGSLSGGRALQLQGERLDNAGTVYSRGSAQVQSHSLTNTGIVVAGGPLALEAQRLQNDGLIGAGLSPDAQGRLQWAATPTGTGALTITSTDTLSQGARGQLLASDQLQASAGRIDLAGAASAAGVALHTTGALQLRQAQLSATQDAALTSAGTLTLDQSQVLAGRDARLTSAQALGLTDSLVQATGRTGVQAGGALTLQSTQASWATALRAGGDLGVNADTLATSRSGTGTGALLAAGLQADGRLAGTGALTVHTTGTLQSEATLLAAGAASLSGSALQLANAQLQGQAVQLQATAGTIDTSAARVQALSALTATGQQLVNRGGQLSADRLVLQLQGLDNRAGSLLHTGTAALDVDVTTLDNRGGLIGTNATDATLKAQNLTTDGGQIQHAGSGLLQLQAGQLSAQAASGMAAQVVSAGQLQALAGTANLTGGVLVANSLDLTATQLTATDAQLAARTGALAITTTGAPALDLRRSVLQSGASAQVSASDDLLTAGATLSAARDLVLTAGGALQHLDGAQAVAGRDLTVVAAQLDVSGNRAVTVNGASTPATQYSGFTALTGALQAQISGALTAQDSQWTAGQGMTLTAQDLTLSGTHTQLAAGQAAGSTAALDLTARRALTARDALLVAPGALTLNAPQLALASSQLSGQDVTLRATGADAGTTPALQVQASKVVAQGDASLRADAGTLATTGSATQAGHVVKNGLSHGQGVLAKRKAADYSCDAARLTAVRGGWSK